jgi:hypothetical protein
MIETILGEILSAGAGYLLAAGAAWLLKALYLRRRYGGWIIFGMVLSISERREYLSSQLARERIVKTAISSAEGRFCKVDWSSLREDRKNRRITCEYE